MHTDTHTHIHKRTMIKVCTLQLLNICVVPMFHVVSRSQRTEPAGAAAGELPSTGALARTPRPLSAAEPRPRSPEFCGCAMHVRPCLWPLLMPLSCSD